MTTDVPSHEEFEIAALRRARGALDARAVARLDAHLASCAACRGFAATADATEAALRGRARAGAAQRDWPQVRAAFDRRVRRGRGRIVRAAGGAVLLILLQQWSLPRSSALNSGPTSTLLVVAMILLVTAAGVLFVLLPRDRRAQAAAASDAELLKFYRDDLDREIRELRTARPVFVVLTALSALLLIFAATSVVSALRGGPDVIEVPKLVAAVAIAGLVTAPAWYRTRVVLPRLERERRELDA